MTMAQFSKEASPCQCSWIHQATIHNPTGRVRGKNIKQTKAKVSSSIIEREYKFAYMPLNLTSHSQCDLERSRYKSRHALLL